MENMFSADRRNEDDQSYPLYHKTSTKDELMHLLQFQFQDYGKSRQVPSLENILDETSHLEQVRKEDLRSGDLIIVVTRNSIYTIQVGENGSYLVSGGWFDRRELSPARTTVVGCTFGGAALKADVIAACGLCLEFGN